MASDLVFPMLRCCFFGCGSRGVRSLKNSQHWLKIIPNEILSDSSSSPICVGVFSNAFATGPLEGKASTSELMGVGSTALACLNLMTPFNPMLARFGTRFIMFFGSVLMSLGVILAGFSTEVWHLYLTQGVGPLFALVVQ